MLAKIKNPVENGILEIDPQKAVKYKESGYGEVEHIAIFDEAQRTWTHERIALYLKRGGTYGNKLKEPNFPMSEAAFLIWSLDQREDWAVIICLVGGGQEINTGEAGISEWINALNTQFKHWNIYISNKLTEPEYAEGKVNELLENIFVPNTPLHDGAVVIRDNKIYQASCVLPLSSNKGLCGTFNANVIRETINLIKDEYQELFDNGKVDILCVGSKVEEALRFKKYPVVGNENILLDDITYDNAAAFAERLMKDFEEKRYDKIIFVYNQFKNAATQVLVTEQLLPISHTQQTSDVKQQETDFIFQPNKEDIYKEMLPKSLKMQVYKILLDSYASEQGARMVSMTQATDNATELLKELNLSYNKARQSAITNELVEIVSGAEALKG